MVDFVVANPSQMQEMSLLDQQIQQAIINFSTSKGAIEDYSQKLALSIAKKRFGALGEPEDVIMRYVFEARLQLCSHLLINKLNISPFFRQGYIAQVFA